MTLKMILTPHPPERLEAELLALRQRVALLERLVATLSERGAQDAGPVAGRD